MNGPMLTHDEAQAIAQQLQAIKARLPKPRNFATMVARKAGVGPQAVRRAYLGKTRYRPVLVLVLKAAQEISVPTELQAIPSKVIHRFYMRPDLQVEIHLPVDMTRHEARRLAAAIATFAMEE